MVCHGGLHRRANRRPGEKGGNADGNEEKFDSRSYRARALLGIVSDIALLTETAERIRIRVAAMAKAHGITIPIE